MPRSRRGSHSGGARRSVALAGGLLAVLCAAWFAGSAHVHDDGAPIDTCVVCHFASSSASDTPDVTAVPCAPKAVALRFPSLPSERRAAVRIDPAVAPRAPPA